jgi:glycosyltransferase involved in cell wall biosynthesis
MRKSHKIDFTPPRSVSIIIPVLNAEGQIDECLDKINALSPPPLEVLVVDGGSTDNTVKKAENYNVSVIKSNPGRGIQICQGVKEARGDISVVLHVDTFLETDTLKKILNSFIGENNIAGGSVGQRFKERGPALRLIEILNDLRASLLGISFGDQVQFFRTQLAREYNLVPEWPLMEDVELSIRLGRYGRRVYIRGGATVSSNKWREGFAKRFCKILYLLAVFFVRRLNGNVDTRDLYNLYYGKAGAVKK